MQGEKIAMIRMTNVMSAKKKKCILKPLPGSDNEIPEAF